MRDSVAAAAAAAGAAAAAAARTEDVGSDVGIAFHYLCETKHLGTLLTIAASFQQLGQRKMCRVGHDFLWLPPPLVCWRLVW